MASLPELRALLIRQQAECLELDQQLNATPVGTKEFGQMRLDRQNLGLAINKTKEGIRTAQQGRQSSLL